jgi:hypothetical protein
MCEHMSDHVDMLTLILTLAGTGAFGVLAARYGVEQRPGFNERPEAFESRHHGLR